MSTALLRMRGATFGYGGRRVLDGVDLDVHAGEILTVLGTNGSGKSTLLRCLGGALSLGGGTVYLGPDDLKSLEPRARARRIGFLFQDHSPSLPFTVAEVVALGRTPHLGFLGGQSANDVTIVNRALEEAGIGHLRQRPYTALSGGERQLVLLARTLAQEPQLILMDEPTAHLDLHNQVRCLQLARALAARGVALVVTTHDPNHAFVLSDRVVLMKPAAPPRIGPAEELLTAGELSSAYGLQIEVHLIPRAGAAPLRVCSPW
jgi:iron complex transport system ATP-binding protein